MKAKTKIKSGRGFSTSPIVKTDRKLDPTKFPMPCPL